MSGVRKQSKPCGGTDRFGIINPWGDVWSYETWETEQAARDHLEQFWRGVKDADTRKFKIERVYVEVSRIPVGRS